MKFNFFAVKNLWYSVGFRLAFYCAFLMTITLVTTVAIIYVQIIVVLHKGVTEQISSGNQIMAERFQEGGAQAVKVEIERALSDIRKSEASLYFYVDARGQKIAGNLDAPLKSMDHVHGIERTVVVRGGMNVEGYVSSTTMPDGSRLLVGNDFRDQKAIDSLVTNGIVSASWVAVLLMVGGLFIFQQELNRSIEPIRSTLTRVAAGQIKERIAPVESKDEIALLGDEINKVLDRIELLMSGIRHVSDTIAHNLRTPLTRILLRLQSVAAEASTGTQQKEKIEAAVLDIEDLITVFEKLLQIGQAEAGARRIGFQAVALNSVVEEVIDFYEAVADQQNARLVFDAPVAATVLGDADLLASAIANLVDNALKYSGPGATVSIKIRNSTDIVSLTVADNGPGIPADKLEKLGTRFFRLNQKIPGHGLGVASVAAVCALHGGHIRFDDAKPGLMVCWEFPLHIA